MLLVYRKK